MRYPSAKWYAGPEWKVNGQVNTCRGVVCHSAVGGLSAALGELTHPTRKASWHFTVDQDGTVYQHYDTSAQCWHAGSNRNNDLIGIEHIGGLDPVDEPLTPAQRDASVALVRWLSKTLGFPLIRHIGLHEHNEVSSAVTQCPSGRIPWAYYTEEDEMDAYTKAEANAKVGALVLQLGKLGADLRNLTSDVQGTFRYAYEHATDFDVHLGDVPVPNESVLQAKIDELQRRLDTGADALRQAAAALGGK